MLPFNKRRGSEIEIQPDEVEPVQLPPVRPPSIRPAAGVAPSRSTSSFPPAAMSSQHRLPPPSPPSVRPSAPSARPSARPPISFRPPADDNERTLFVAEKQPRRTLDLRQPKVPNFDEPSVMVTSSPRDSFSDDEATRIHPNSSRSVLSMSAPISSRRLPEDSSGRVRSDVPPPPPPSSVRVEEPRSAAAVDMSMTVGAGASQSQQVTSRNGKLNPGRPTAVWAAALVAVGVFTGLAAALVARGGSDSVVTASAALIDPSQGQPQVVANAANAAPVQNAAPVVNVQGAATQQQQQVAQAVSQALQPAASCAADVTPTAKAADTKVAAAPVAIAEAKAPEPKVAAVVAPPPAPKPAAAPAAKPVIQQPKVAAAAPPPAPKPAAAPAPKPAKGGSDAESAAAADALAKAQLEAALGR